MGKTFQDWAGSRFLPKQNSRGLMVNQPKNVEFYENPYISGGCGFKIYIYVSSNWIYVSNWQKSQTVK